MRRVDTAHFAEAILHISKFTSLEKLTIAFKGSDGREPNKENNTIAGQVVVKHVTPFELQNMLKVSKRTPRAELFGNVTWLLELAPSFCYTRPEVIQQVWIADKTALIESESKKSKENSTHKSKDGSGDVDDHTTLQSVTQKSFEPRVYWGVVDRLSDEPMRQYQRQAGLPTTGELHVSYPISSLSYS